MPSLNSSFLCQLASAAVMAQPVSASGDPTATTWGTVQYLLPELLLIIACAAIYVGGAFLRNRPLWNLVALLALAIAGGIIIWQSGQEVPFSAGPLAIDTFAWLGRWLAIGFGALLIVAAWNEGNPGLGSEYAGSLLATVVGGMLAAQARDLVLLFVGLELVSIPTYVVLFLGRRSAENQEATAKYFFLSIMSSAVLLYGMSFVYGITGTTLLPSDHVAWRNLLEVGGAGAHGLQSFAPFAVVLLLAGLGFKVAIVPFHFYAPDVYQGTSSTNAAVLAVVPKLAGMVALVRVGSTLFTPDAVSIWQIVIVLAIATMTVGNVSALWQSHVRRLLAFSSVAHGGYLLIGLAVALAPSEGSEAGIAALLFYLVVYGLAALGAFGIVSSLRGPGGKEIESVEELAGLGRSSPIAAALLAVFLFSLAGIPPLGGFWGKLGIFASAVRIATGSSSESWWFITLALLGVVNAAIAAAYYLRVIAVMYFQGSEEREGANVADYGGLTSGIACGLLVITLGVAPGLMALPASEAGKSVTKTAATPMGSQAAAVSSR